MSAGGIRTRGVSEGGILTADEKKGEKKRRDKNVVV